MNNSLMSLENVSVAYQGDITVLNDITLHACTARVTGIIGPNGAGKSTVLKTLFGLLPLQDGDVHFKGQSIRGQGPHTRAASGIAYVPQNRSLFAELSVQDNLQLGCWTFRKNKALVRRRIDAVYARFPILEEKRQNPVASLSGGQQRFVEFGRALLLEPTVMLLDEPTAMLAPKISKEIYTQIRKFADEGMAVVLVDQNVRRCVEVSDYTYILELGKNKAQGKRDVFNSDTGLREMIGAWMDYKID